MSVVFCVLHSLYIDTDYEEYCIKCLEEMPEDIDWQEWNFENWKKQNDHQL